MILQNLMADFDAIRRRGATPVSIEMTKAGNERLAAELNAPALAITVSRDVKINSIYSVPLRLVDTLPEGVLYHIVVSDARVSVTIFIVFMPPFAPSVEALRGACTSLEAAKKLVEEDKVTDEFRRTRPYQWERRQLFGRDCHVAEYDAKYGKAHAIIVEINVESTE